MLCGLAPPQREDGIVTEHRGGCLWPRAACIEVDQLDHVAALGAAREFPCANSGKSLIVPSPPLGKNVVSFAALTGDNRPSASQAQRRKTPVSASHTAVMQFTEAKSVWTRAGLSRAEWPILRCHLGPIGYEHLDLHPPCLLPRRDDSVPVGVFGDSRCRSNRAQP